jgi:hypothetical protein
MENTPVDVIVASLEAHGCKPRRSGDGWSALCPIPAHDDHSPSLSVSEGSDGRALVNCHAGCRTEDVVVELGRTMADLFPPRAGGNGRRVADIYPYTDEHGELLFETVKFEPKDFRQRRPDGNGGWIPNLHGVRRVPYRLPQLLGVAPGGMVFITEGEKDADTLARAGLVATTNPGGALKWPQEWGERYFAGLSVVVLPDNDDPGRRHAAGVVVSVLPHADESRLIELPGLSEHGDVSDWLVEHTVDELLGLVEAQPLLSTASADEDLLELVDWSVVHDPVDDLVDGYVIPGRWTQNVVGAKGGKSSWTMWVAVELSEGRDPIDGTPRVPVTVLYCDGEMGRLDLEQLIRDMGHDPSKLRNLRCSVHRPRLDTWEGAGVLLRRVERLGAGLVVLDGLNGYVPSGVSENDDTVWRELYDCTVQPLKERGAAVLSNDNMGKDPGKGSRGWSGKNDKADAVVVVAKTDTGLRLTTRLQRAGVFFDGLDLDAEGFDRSKAIRYRRAKASGWPAGTHPAVAILDGLSIPFDWGARRVRKAVRDAGQSVGNEALAAAIRFRKTRPVQVP